MAIDLNKGATVELVKALSDDIRTLPDGTKATSAGAETRYMHGKLDKIEYNLARNNIVQGVINGRFVSVDNGVKIVAYDEERLLYFPVIEGKTYTVYKGSGMLNCRIAYSTNLPQINTIATNYGNLGGANSLIYKEITAPITGFGIARIAYAGDDLDAVLEKAYVSEGSYQEAYSPTNAKLNDILNINGVVQNQLLEFTDGKYIYTPAPGAEMNYTLVNMSTVSCAKVTLRAGQKVLINGTSRDNSGTRAVCFANASNISVYRYLLANALKNYEFIAPENGTLIINLLSAEPHSAYLVYENTAEAVVKQPVTLLPDYIIKAMAYRPVGSLEKGYICMMTDDGTNGLATYTIPLAIEKNVPFTFALAKESQVFQNESYQNTVIDAINNHNCSIAQHSVTSYWDTLSEAELNDFFDEQKQFFNGLGLEVRGAAIPGHRTNDIIKAVAGGRFGVVRSGYDGQGTDFETNHSVINCYDYYATGARSNLYALSSWNITGTTDAYNKAAVDYAIQNKKILICYFHEFDLDNDKKQSICSMIDYAKANSLEFITLGDIPTLR